MERTTILDIPFISTTFTTFIDEIKQRCEQQQRTFIVTANPEIVIRSLKDPTFKQEVLKADYVTPDGIGVIQASNRLGTPIQERITGFDTCKALLKYADSSKKSVFLLGADPNVMAKTVKKIKKDYPSLQLVGHHHGYFSEEEGKQISKNVTELQPDFIFVALGSPKQEQWIVQQLAHANKGIFMGVGGSFDVLSGSVKRAPNWMIRLNLEWLYRITSDPKRMKRSLPPLVSFRMKTRKKDS